MKKPIDSQHLARLQTALHGLPARQRAIFLALVDEEATYAMLAQRLSIDVAEVEREFACALIALDAAASE